MLDELFHAGTRHSGRYKHGWGENPHQHCMDFQAYVYKLRKQKVPDIVIAKSAGLKNTTELRRRLGIADAEIEEHNRYMTQKLYNEDQYSKQAIAKRLGISPTTVSKYLNPSIKSKASLTKATAEVLKKEVADKGYIDVSAGTERYLNIGSVRLKNSLALLQSEGYYLQKHKFQQLTTDKDTWMNVLAAPGTQWEDVQKNLVDVKLPTTVYSTDGGATYIKREKPVSIDPSRIYIRYAEDGGTQKDGVVELRRGVDDLSLGKANYAQVRIAVNDSHYIKGMAMYSDNIPDGYDIVVNSNKKQGTPMLGDPKNTVLKPMKNDNDNPFGARIRGDDELVLFQRHYTDKDGNEKLSALNVVSEEGNWNEWSKTLASQFLSKQPPALARKQLDEMYSRFKVEYEECQSVTNPTLRAAFLEHFADECDRNSYELKAAALPRQSTKAILPVPELPDTDIYAPGYKDGEKVALVRYPHAGIFEIPVLTVNNKNAVAKNTIGNARDAVGITPKTAEQLSGADFDGDTVLVLPIGNYNIRSKHPFKELLEFDPKSFKNDSLPEIADETKNIQMGKATNLIADMTIKGASNSELIRAVKYSMVVIDSKKHHLDYRRAYNEFDIAQLCRDYQGSAQGGASTAITRAGAPVYSDELQVNKAYSKMSPEDKARYKEGYTIWSPTGRKRGKPIKDKDGVVIGWENVDRVTTRAKMVTVDDAYDILPEGMDRSKLKEIEVVYLNHANRMKAMAKAARQEARSLVDITYNPASAKVYSDEVEKINNDIEAIERNQPLERQAQLIATKWVRAKKIDNRGLDKEHWNRLKKQELEAARRLVGANRIKVTLNDKQWEAIQAGAITKTKLLKLVLYADQDQLKSYAIPRTKNGVTPAVEARVRSLKNQGATLSEIAELMDLSPSTISKIV